MTAQTARRLTNKDGSARIRLHGGKVVYRAVYSFAYRPRGEADKNFDFHQIVYGGRTLSVRAVTPEPPRRFGGVWLTYEQIVCDACRSQGWTYDKVGYGRTLCPECS